jgi:hypothetical protein
MTKTVRSYVVSIGVLSLCVVGLMIVYLGPRTARSWREFERLRQQGTLIRYPNSSTATNLVRTSEGQPLPNIAPLARVTVSSIDVAAGASGGGVADGVVDAREWLSHSQGAGAWIMLDWDKPALIGEIDLYDRLSPEDNVLGGTLSFGDGTVLAVGALPKDGTPARITFPARAVSWIVFRIDNAEGTDAGLEEIMVRGTLNP